ncbi:MAG: polysaccharide deacetylase family protein [Hyphomicrobiaceae bacterium]|nr:polysaccharide deacetylase family protein [Hyphomicrobiaceae bacterium]
MDIKYLGLRAAFETFWATRIARLVRLTSRARGAIFTLHRVVPEAPADFSPNAILQVTPDFLEYFIIRIRELGYEIVTIDEAIARISSHDAQPRFAVLTLDDAYRDNLAYALPILRKYKAPFTLYVPTAFVDGVGEVWWQLLEDVIAAQRAIAVPDPNGAITYLETKSQAQKQAAYKKLYWEMRAMPNPRRVAVIRELGQRYGIEATAHCRSLIMDWSELQTFAEEPLCTIGAHTVRHYELSTLSEAEARAEMQQSAEVLEAQIGTRPQHLSYPIGAARSASDREFALAGELGFRSGVTTRPGALYYRHRESLMSLPRISLNGHFQAPRYVDVFAAPAIFTSASSLMG